MNLVQYSPVKPQFHRISFGVSVATTRTVGRVVPNAPQSPAADTPEYAYQYDDIGNRITSTDITTNRTYTANSLNQYSAITTSDFGLQTSSFEPQFDDDGNQTLIQTSTGIWQVQYNGENRPTRWGDGNMVMGLPDYSGYPDATYNGVSFLSACDYHDYCYSNCHKGKDDCDKGLRRLAKKAYQVAASKMTFSNPKEKNDWQDKCDAWANAYYNAVKIAGQDAYKDRQLKACECSCSKRDLRFGAYDAKLEHYYPPIKP